MKYSFSIMTLLMALVISGCQNVTEVFQQAEATAINAFSIDVGGDLFSGHIDDAKGVIQVWVPEGTNRNGLVPEISFSGRSLSPAPGTAVDFTSPVMYQVEGWNGVFRTYRVTVALGEGGTLVSIADVPDPGLREAMEKASGKKFGMDLTMSDLASIRWIDLGNDNKVSDLKGLDLLKGLDNLNLGNNSFSTAQMHEMVTPEHFPQLSKISLFGDGSLGVTRTPSDYLAILGQFSSWESISYWSFSALTTADFQVLFDTVLLPNKATLKSLGFNGFAGIKPELLTQLPVLESLNIGWNDVLTTLEPIQTLTGLKSLYLTGANGITDLTPLKTLYDAGAFQAPNPDNNDGVNRIEIENMSLDLSEGSANAAVVAYLVSKGVKVIKTEVLDINSAPYEVWSASTGAGVVISDYVMHAIQDGIPDLSPTAGVPEVGYEYRLAIPAIPLVAYSQDRIGFSNVNTDLGTADATIGFAMDLDNPVDPARPFTGAGSLFVTGFLPSEGPGEFHAKGELVVSGIYSGTVKVIDWKYVGDSDHGNVTAIFGISGKQYLAYFGYNAPAE